MALQVWTMQTKQVTSESKASSLRSRPSWKGRSHTAAHLPLLPPPQARLHFLKCWVRIQLGELGIEKSNRTHSWDVPGWPGKAPCQNCGGKRYRLSLAVLCTGPEPRRIEGETMQASGCERRKKGSSSSGRKESQCLCLTG